MSEQVSKPEMRKGKIKSLLSRLKRGLPIAWGVLSALLVLVLYHFVIVRPGQLTEAEIESAMAQAMASATPRPSNASLVYQFVQPSLVVVNVERQNGSGLYRNRFESGLGTGVIVDIFGDILTSRHIIDGADKVTVTFVDGTESNVQIIQEMPELDLVMLQAYDTPLSVTPAVLGNPDQMRVGDDVYVVGHPFGLYGSMSTGVISGFDRVFQLPDSDAEISGMIQVDAAINPGNSGGPLLNRGGQVIGIITGILNPTEDSFFIGIGFAVPINTALGGSGSLPY